MFNLDFFRRSSLMGTTLRAAPSKSYAFSTNYYACIAMPTWPRCAPPILCWPWPPYPFDGHNVLKRTKISTSEKPTILHGGSLIRLKPVRKFDVWKAISATFSVYLGECSHLPCLQPLWSKLFVHIKTHWLSNKLKVELISSNGKTRWYTFWLWWYKRCTVREPMRFETVLCVIHYGKYMC